MIKTEPILYTNSDNPPIEQIKSLIGFLGTFSKEAIDIRGRIIDIDNFRIEEFTMPEWPQEAGEITIKLWPRKLTQIRYDTVTKLPIPHRSLCMHITVKINQDGRIEIILKSRMTGWRSYESKNATRFGNPEQGSIANCFIIFHQLLEVICEKVIEKLTSRLVQMEIEVQEYNRLVEAIKKSFEPLIPFIVADKMAE